MALTQVKTSGLADDAVTLAKQAAGTDGQIITYDASGNPTAVGPGTDGQVLTSTGAGSPPAFEALPASGATINNATENELVTVASTTSQLDAEANLTFDGNDLTLGDGDLIIGTSGHGISFAATSDGSGTDSSELLDDYEEGTFTPYFHLGSSPGAVTSGGSYAQQDGRYTKIGRFVSATFAVQGAHPASSFDNWSSGDGFIKGWPYPFQGSQPQQVAFCRIHGTAGSWGTTYAPYVIYENYSDKVHLQGYNSGGVEPPGNAGNSFGYWGSLQYHAS